MQFSSPPDLMVELDGDYSATLHTSLGDISVAFKAGEAPLAVNNFLFLAKEGFYDGVIFHRVISGFTSKPQSANRAIAPVCVSANGALAAAQA